MISYIIEASVCWAGFYSLYALLLRQTTFFKANRWYLLGTLLLGLGMPLSRVALPIPEAASAPVAYYLQPITVGVEQLEVAVTTSNANGAGFDYFLLLCWIYGLGVLVFGSRLGYGLWQIARLYRHAQKEKHDSFTLVRTSSAHLPFSFFNCLFWSEKMDLESEDARAIIRHEQVHINGWHSLDVLLLEILGVALWCSPFPYLYRRALRTTHEYLADEAVLQTAGRKKYGHLLLRQSQSGLQIALANHFFQTQLKQRIMMMTRRKTAQRAMARYLLALPLALLFTLVFHNRELIGQTLLEIHQADGTVLHRELQDNKQLDDLFRPDEIATVDVRKEGALDKIIVRLKGDEASARAGLDTLPDGEEVFKVVEDMPRFPGCEELEDQALQNCANGKLLEFIYTQLKYPQDARDAKQEGMVVVSFVVNKAGRLDDFKIARSVSPSLDAEVLRVVRLMNEMEEPWIAGKQRGRTVNVQLNLPIRFKLDEEVTQDQELKSTSSLPVRDFLASPNPSSGQLRLRFEAAAEPTIIRLLDSNGREARRENLTRFEGLYDQQLDLSKLPKGAYILHISQGDKSFTEKLILN